MQVWGVPEQVLHVESHSMHYSFISTLISGKHDSIQLSWKKYL